MHVRIHVYVKMISMHLLTVIVVKEQIKYKMNLISIHTLLLCLFLFLPQMYIWFIMVIKPFFPLKAIIISMIIITAVIIYYYCPSFKDFFSIQFSFYCPVHSWQVWTQICPILPANTS